MIDPYLIEDSAKPGKWWCFYKQKGVSISYSYDLVTWTYAGKGAAGENVTVLKDEKGYVMFHSPRNSIGIKTSEHIYKWGEDIAQIYPGQTYWERAKGRITAATVTDLRHISGIGKYIMFFHGESINGREYAKAHGFASIGIAWCDDLLKWEYPISK